MLPQRECLPSNGNRVITIYDVGPQLTMENAHEMMGLIRTLPTVSAPSVVVNMAKTTAIDSTGVGALVSIMRHVRNLNGVFCVAGLNPEIERVFEMMQLTSVFTVFTTNDLAFKYLNSHNMAERAVAHD